MELTLLGTTVHSIVDNGTYLYHFTEAGVDIHRLSDLVRVAYASLVNTTAGAVNKNGVYLGTSNNGVYLLPLTSISGDVTANLVQSYTAPTVILGNAIVHIAAYDRFLAIASTVGIDYFNNSTRYSMTLANVTRVDINDTNLSYIANGIPYLMPRPIANWTNESSRKLSFDKDNYALSKLTNPSTTGNQNSSSAIDWYNNYAAIGGSGGFLCLYRRDADVLTKLASYTIPLGGSPYSCSWNSNGIHLAVISSIAPYILLYRRDNEVLTKLIDPPSVGMGMDIGCSCKWSGDYLVVSTNDTPYISFYRRDGDTLIKLANPSALPNYGRGVDWNGNYLAVTHFASPYLTLYRRDGDTLTKLAAPSALTGNGCKVKWYGNFLAVSHTITPFLSLYKLETNETLTKLSAPFPLASNGYGLCWYDNYLIVLSQFAPYLNLYRLDGNVLSKLANSTDLSSTGGNYAEAAFSGDHLVVGVTSTPFINFYKMTYNTLQSLGFAQDIKITDSDCVFISYQSGVRVYDRNYNILRTISGVFGSSNDVKVIKPSLLATRNSGLLAYGTDVQFGVLNLSI